MERGSMRFSRLLFSTNSIYLTFLLINLTSNNNIRNIGNVNKKLIFILKKDEVMVKEKIVMLMSLVGYPVFFEIIIEFPVREC